MLALLEDMRGARKIGDSVDGFEAQVYLAEAVEDAAILDG